MDLHVEVTVGALLVATLMIPMSAAAEWAKSVRTWLIVLAPLKVRTANVGPAIKASVPMPTRHAAIFNEALEQGFCCVLTICFIERSFFFDDGYTLALNGAITVCMISDILPHVTHRQMQFIDKLVSTRLHLTSQEFLHAAADAVQRGLELQFEQSLNAIEIRPQPSENANRCRKHFFPAAPQESGF